MNFITILYRKMISYLSLRIQNLVPRKYVICRGFPHKLAICIKGQYTETIRCNFVTSKFENTLELPCIRIASCTFDFESVWYIPRTRSSGGYISVFEAAVLSRCLIEVGNELPFKAGWWWLSVIDSYRSTRHHCVLQLHSKLSCVYHGIDTLYKTSGLLIYIALWIRE